MWNDPIVQEIHAIRLQLLAQAGGDLHEAIRQAHQTHQVLSPDRKVFHGQPRRRFESNQNESPAGPLGAA